MTPKRQITVLGLILAGFGLTLLALFALAWVVLDTLSAVRQSARDLYQHPYVVTRSIEDLRANLYQLRGDMLLAVVLDERVRDLAQERLDDPAQQAAIEHDLAVISAQFLGDPAQPRLLAERFAAWNAVREAVLADLAQGRQASAELRVREDGRAAFNAIQSPLEAVSGYARAKAESFVVAADSAAERGMHHLRWLVCVLALLVVLVAIGVTLRVRRLHAYLTRLAMTDDLTGVANRRRFMALAQEAFALHRRYPAPLAVAIADLDLFKQINDAYGHEVGDLVLREFCQLCTAHLRGVDIVGRIGGEEFAFLFPHTGAGEAQQVLERLRATVNSFVVRAGAGREVRFTATFGVSMAHPQDTGPEAALARADQALYAAKLAGRNLVHLL